MSQGDGWWDKVDVSDQGLMNQAAEPEAGKITRCILHIFFSKLTIKNGILYKWFFFFFFQHVNQLVTIL